MLYLEDYLYNFESDGKNPGRWNCAQRKSNACPVYLVTNPLEGDEQSEEILDVIGVHTHGQENKNSVKAEPKTSPIQNIAIKNKLKKDTHPLDRKSEAKKVQGTATVVKASTSGEVIRRTSTMEEFEHNHVYLLVTNNGRELICVNGYMYRLEGKSKTSATFRWECIRSDVGCKTRIYTARIDENRHQLRQPQAVVNHEEHEAYTPRHLSKLISKHKMQLVDDGSARKWLKIEAKPAAKNSTVGTTKSHASLIPDYSMSSPRTDPLTPLKGAIISKSMLGKKSFTIMPSAKGNRVLCVDNMIFHYDQPSPVADRSYWTCLLRRDKRYKCKCRLVMEESKDGLQIRKMSGRHNHADHTAKIDRRLNALGLRREDIDGANITEITTQPSKKLTKRSIPMADINSLITRIKENDDSDDANDDDCSVSSASPTPQQLPERLEQMRRNEQIITEDGLVTVERVDFSVSQSSEMFETENSEQITEAVAINKTPALKSNAPRCKKRKHSEDGVNWGRTEYDMDTTKVSRLRSAKGRFLLCVDDYIYYMKREQKNKNHWVCIKNRDREIQCKSFLTTASNTKGGKIEVVWVTNGHNHPVCEQDIKRRLCNELIASGAVPRRAMQFSDYFRKSLDEVKKECAEILLNYQNKLASEGVVMCNESRTMKLYAVSDGPPSLAVRMTLKALNIPYELKNVDYIAAEHMTESYAKMNPQKEIPVLDDNGFFLPESIAIMQYLCDKYAPDSEIYPKDATARALVNHRLCFNMGFYYASISMHAMAPIFFDYPRNEMTLKKVQNALDVFDTYLERNGTKYAAGEHVTLADFALVSSTLCLEAIGFDVLPWHLVKTWYETFKTENPDLWDIAKGGMKEIAEFEKYPPDLSHMNHPFHPTKKVIG